MSRLTIGAEASGRMDPSWTPSGNRVFSSGSSEEDEPGTSSLDTLNDALKTLSGGNFRPITFQLNCTWEQAKPWERELCIEKAEEAVKVLCDVIAPNDGQSLFASLLKQSHEPCVSDDLASLFTAFASASTRRLKIQILSIYAQKVLS